MRADRLIAVLMLLQTHGQVTAAQVAEALEVSTRTARRDLDALAMSGVPIYSQAGRGGGWRLIGGAKTDLTGLSADESRALFVALAHQGDSNPALDAALRKLTVAVPEGFRDDAVAATGAIRVDPTGWGQIGPAVKVPWVDVLSDAVIAGQQATMRYRTPNKAPSDRVVHPLGLVTKRGVWYLVANTDKGIRTFRVSRIERVDVLNDPVIRPPDFDLDATWEAIVTTVESQRGGLVVHVAVTAHMLRSLQYVFSNRSTVTAERNDGWFEVTITETSPESLAAQIVGFGKSLQLIDPPPAVVAQMKRITQELADQWLVPAR